MLIWSNCIYLSRRVWDKEWSAPWTKGSGTWRGPWRKPRCTRTPSSSSSPTTEATQRPRTGLYEGRRIVYMRGELERFHCSIILGLNPNSRQDKLSKYIHLNFIKKRCSCISKSGIWFFWFNVSVSPEKKLYFSFFAPWRSDFNYSVKNRDRQYSDSFYRNFLIILEF